MATEYKPNKNQLFTKPADPTRCKAGVWSGDRFASYYQCTRKAKRDGWCAQHHPDAEAERERKRDEKFDREQRAREIRWRRPEVMKKQIMIALGVLDTIGGRETPAGELARHTAADIRKALEGVGVHL